MLGWAGFERGKEARADASGRVFMTGFYFSNTRLGYQDFEGSSTHWQGGCLPGRGQGSGPSPLRQLLPPVGPGMPWSWRCLMP